jgi:hypothetical protein
VALLLVVLSLFAAHKSLAVELAGSSVNASSIPMSLETLRMPQLTQGTPTVLLKSGSSSSSIPQGTILHTSDPVSGFTININAGPTLAAMPDALAAFQRAAQQWTSRFSNPITVTIDADMANLGTGGIIGSTGSFMLQGGYTSIRDQVVASAAAEGSSNAIVAALPNVSQFQVSVPTGYTLNGDLYSTKANLKALGYTGLDEAFGVSDAQIQFNTLFPFTYNNKTGVAPMTIDFESTAAHEIGHALGFISSVDDLDYAMKDKVTGAFSPTILDLFRFASAGADHPTTVSDFTTFPRELAPGYEESTIGSVNLSGGLLSDSEYAMSTGYNTGDGRQASHWKDNGITGQYVGLMNPTIGYGEIHPITDADIRALDLIGYTPVPEPGFFILIGSGLAGWIFVSRQRGRSVQ